MGGAQHGTERPGASRRQLHGFLSEAEPVHVLLVEDNPADVRLVKEALHEGRLAVDLDVARDGAEAQEILSYGAEAKRLPDLILLDLNLPKVDGHDVLRWIRDQPALSSLPVVILTTSTDEADIHESYRLMANSFITKPVDYDDFIDTIRGLGAYWFALVKLPVQERPSSEAAGTDGT